MRRRPFEGVLQRRVDISIKPSAVEHHDSGETLLLDPGLK